VQPNLDTTPTNASNKNTAITLNETTDFKKETKHFLRKFNENLASFDKFDDYDEKTKAKLINKMIELFSSIELDLVKNAFMNSNECKKLMNLSKIILRTTIHNKDYKFPFIFFEQVLALLNKQDRKEITKLIIEQFENVRNKSKPEIIIGFHSLIFSHASMDSTEFCKIADAIDLHVDILDKIELSEVSKILEIHAKIFNLIALPSNNEYIDENYDKTIKKVLNIQKKILSLKHNLYEDDLLKLVIDQQKNILDFVNNSHESFDIMFKTIGMSNISNCASIEHIKRLVHKNELFDQILKESDIDTKNVVINLEKSVALKNDVIKHQNEIKKIIQENLKNPKLTLDQDMIESIFSNIIPDKNLITEIIDLQIKAINNITQDQIVDQVIYFAAENEEFNISGYVNELEQIEAIMKTHAYIFNSFKLKDIKNNIYNFSFNDLNVVIEKVMKIQKNIYNLTNFDEKDLLKLVTNQQESIFKLNEKMVQFFEDFPENADLKSILKYLVDHHSEIFNKITNLLSKLEDMSQFKEEDVIEIIAIILEYHQLILSFPKLIKNNKEFMENIFKHWRYLKDLNLDGITKEIKEDLIKQTLEMSNQILNDFESFVDEEIDKSDLIIEINKYTNNIAGELLENPDETSQIIKSILNVIIGLKDVESVGDFIKRIYKIIRHNRYARIFFWKILKILLDLALFLLAYFAYLSACFKNDWFGYFYFTYLYFILLVCLILSLNDFFIFYNTEFDNEVAKHYIEIVKASKTNFEIDRSKTYIELLKSLIFLPNEILFSISYIINKYSNIFEFCFWNFKNRNYKFVKFFSFALSLFLIVFSYFTASFSFYLILENCNQINICSIFVLFLLLCKLICEMFKFFYFSNFKTVNENETISSNFIRHIRHEEHLTAGCVLKENCNSFDLEHIVYCHSQLNSRPQIFHLDLKKIFCPDSFKNYMIGFYSLNENNLNFVKQKHQIEGIKKEKYRSNEIEAICFTRF